MSMTIPSASSSARRKVTSTTKVAPCSRCAGPKTSPRKLCATMMWSRTVTLNPGSLPVSGAVVFGAGAFADVVGDEVAQRRQGARGQPGQHLGQLVEAGLAGE